MSLFLSHRTIHRTIRPLLTAALLTAAALFAGCGENDTTPPRPEVPVEEPAWFAAFDGADQQFLFVSELRRYFDDRGETAEIDADGRLEVTGRAGRQDFVVARLAEAAAERPSDEWPEMIRRHFEAMAALRDAIGDVAVPGFDEARPRLRLRIYPDEFLSGAGLAPADVVHRVDLPGTRTVLVVDSEQTALVVPRGELARWQQDADNVLALGFANTRRALEGQLEVVSREFPDVGELKVLTGDSFYTATAALWMDAFDGVLGAHGAVVAIPWRQGVIVYPFDDARVLKVVPALYRYAERIVQDSVGPIGTRIWWRRPDGRFEPIGITEVDGRLEIDPPRDLAELLSKLPQEHR